VAERWDSTIFTQVRLAYSQPKPLPPASQEVVPHETTSETNRRLLRLRCAPPSKTFGVIRSDGWRAHVVRLPDIGHPYLSLSPLRWLPLVVPFGVNPQGTGLSFVIRGHRPNSQERTKTHKAPVLTGALVHVLDCALHTRRCGGSCLERSPLRRLTLTLLTPERASCEADVASAFAAAAAHFDVTLTKASESEASRERSILRSRLRALKCCR
jgi:hypothetical protein